MGVKVSKENQQIKRRFNHLKSLMADNDPEYQQDFRMSNTKKKSTMDRAPTLKFTRAGTKALTLGLRLPSQEKFEIKKGHKRSPSISEQNEDSLANLQDNMTEEDEFELAVLQQFNLEPLSPRTFLRQNKNKLDNSTREALGDLIKSTFDQAVKDRRVYLLSEKTTEENEKPLEIENKARVYDENEEKDESFKKNDYAHEDNWDNALSKQSLYDLGVAATCRKGESSEVCNQDNFFVYIDPYTRIYSVYDGHGPFGNEVSHYVCMSLAKRILEDPVSLLDPAGAIRDAFEKTKSSLEKYVKKEKAVFDCHLSGTSVTLVFQRGLKLYVGQLGDSKVLIGRRLKNKKTLQLEQLNTDHTPELTEEKQRIYSKGGEVRKWTDGLDRVFVKGRVFPCLATTRSLGDDVGSLIGIDSEPEITTYDLNEQTDKFLLIGTNAVFTYLEDPEILNVVNFASSDKIKETADILVKKALNGWKLSENTYDDMTLIFAYFPWSEPKRA